MQPIIYSNTRNNLRELINSVCDDFEKYKISTKDDKKAVLISFDEYSAMKETLYLLSSKNNRDRLLESIKEVKESKVLKKEINI